jgi:hypothetical protein
MRGDGLDFRTRLLETLRAIEPVLREPGVLVAGSEVPNLMEPDARASLVVSQDVDLAIPVSSHAAVKQRLPEIVALEPSREEPSVWIPKRAELIEVNFIGMDTDSPRAGQTYVLEDSELPLLVFGHLSLLKPGESICIDGLTIPLPRSAGLILEKLLTDRSGIKGDRDLLVVLGLMLVARAEDSLELEQTYRQLAPDLRYLVRSNLTLLSLLEPHEAMPDPTKHRLIVAELLSRLEQTEATQ